MPLRQLLPIALFVLVLPMNATASEPSDLASILLEQDFVPRDRLTILNLLHAYSHAADGLQTELFGELFTENAAFRVVPHGGDDASPPQTIGDGRIGIVAALAERHEAFRKSGTQRRHFLTNPIIWNQTETTAEVSVYLQLRSSTKGAASKLVATGRYQGRVSKTASGWRISEWTLFSDQTLN